MKHPTQAERVLDYLERHGSITQKEADTIAVARLSARIYDLRADGFEFDSVLERGKNRFNQDCVYSRYYLRGGDPNGREADVCQNNH